MAGEADGVIDAIVAVAPSHTPGTRPIHAPGVGATGVFQATDVASSFTEAAHFSGPPVPVTVRFSNGTGSMAEADNEPVVRGLATRFHLAGGTIVDMVAMTLPVFFTRTMESFMDFLGAVRPDPVPPTPKWRKALDALRLQPGPSRPLRPGEPGAIRFANGHPEARQAVVGLTALAVPQSYVTCTYHAVHAFVLTAGGTATAVRFRWEPIAGVRPAADDVKPIYLEEELRGRLARGPAEFVLRMQVAEHGDDTSDPTKSWPESRKRVVMGHLRVDAMVDDQRADNERLDFNPTRLVPGIAMSDDPILRARQEAYRRSAERRLSTPPI